MAFDLEKYKLDDVNLIEIVLQTGNNNINIHKKMDLSMSFGNGNKTNIVEYYMSDMCYIYDKSNDGQKVTRRVPTEYDYLSDKLVVIVYNEETLPTHRFPCTNDMNHKVELERKSYRVNNRVFIIHDMTSSGIQTITIQYRHSNMVDTKKMNQDLQNAIAKLMRLYNE